MALRENSTNAKITEHFDKRNKTPREFTTSSLEIVVWSRNSILPLWKDVMEMRSVLIFKKRERERLGNSTFLYAQASW